MTAYEAVVRRLRITARDTVLVTGGSGGVGGFAVQLAAATGARVIATATPKYQAAVREYGASDVIDHRSEDVVAAVKAMTHGRGVDAIVDSVSSASATEKLSLLTHGGGIACIAGRPEMNRLPSFTTAPSVHEIALGAAYNHGTLSSRKWLSSMLTDLLARVADGRLSPMVTEIVPLVGARTALSEIPFGSRAGKLVVRV